MSKVCIRGVLMHTFIVYGYLNCVKSAKKVNGILLEKENNCNFAVVRKQFLHE